MDGLMAKNLSDTEIAQMFSDYVTRMEDRERHTAAAVKEADAFDTFCESEFPRNVRLQTNLYSRMMNTAVEFEESGFIAGFRTAVALLSGQEELLPVQAQNTTPKAETTLHEAVNDPQGVVNEKDTNDSGREYTYVEEPGVINTKTIAELFETRHARVVKRIENVILPQLDETTKKNFVRVEGYNARRRLVVFYKLNKVACDLYLRDLLPFRKSFINVAGGCAKMYELMGRVFPAENISFPELNTETGQFTEEVRRCEAPKKPKKKKSNEDAKYIDTTQIAEMFSRSNFKTVRAIENGIIPYLTKEEKGDFVIDVKRDRYKKEQIIYKLSLNGCKKYLEYCQQYMNFMNFVEGVEKLKAAIEDTWGSVCEVA